jgi:uncharacterized protein (DUF1778 family)
LLPPVCPELEPRHPRRAPDLRESVSRRRLAIPPLVVLKCCTTSAKGEHVATRKKAARVTRSVRVSVSLTPESAELVQRAAELSGVSVSAWCAFVLSQQARNMTDARDMVMSAARSAVTESIGKASAEDLAALLESGRGDETP